MSVACRDGLEDRLMQGEFGLVTECIEGHSQNRFGLPRFAVRVGPAPGGDETFRLGDFAKHALRPMIIAVGSAHVKAIRAACARVHLTRHYAEATRAPPARQMLGFGPGLEDETAGRVKDA